MIDQLSYHLEEPLHALQGSSENNMSAERESGIKMFY